jgi:predicted component of type VI protein secretion system
MSVDYYLVSAARRAHRLRPDRAYVFGREEGVDIVLQDALVSRRHAELCWIGEGYWEVKDLGSRNGVFVNGSRIPGPTKIDDGGQLQVGGQVYRLHLLPPGGDPASLSNQAPQISNLETMGPGFNLQDIANQGATFTGEVTAGGVLDLLQFFQATSKSGRLDLVGGPNLASVWIAGGSPTHATHDSAQGIDALVRLAMNPPPRFAFHADAPPTAERTLQGSMQGILMEVARMLDEQKR